MAHWPSGSVRATASERTPRAAKSRTAFSTGACRARSYRGHNRGIIRHATRTSKRFRFWHSSRRTCGAPLATRYVRPAVQSGSLIADGTIEAVLARTGWVPHDGFGAFQRRVERRIVDLLELVAPAKVGDAQDLPSARQFIDAVLGAVDGTRTIVSSASFGGSFHFVASDACRRTSARVTPGRYVGHSFWITILFSVSVPVLSEHRTVIPDSLSIADKHATIA